MGEFHYIAIDAGGVRRKGHISASHLDEAKEKLRLSNQTILQLQEKKGIDTKKKRVKKGELITFTEQLSELVFAKIPLYDALVSLEESAQGSTLQPILLVLIKEMKEGQLLSQSLRNYPSIFSPLYIALIACGERIGAVDEALKKVSLLLKKEHQMKKKITSALLYPALLLLFSSVVILSLFFFVIPSLEELFEGRTINSLTHLLITMSHLIRQYGYLLFLLLLSLITALFFLPNKREKCNLLLLKVPLLKRVIFESALARFFKTLGCLLQGGINMTEAIAISKSVVTLFPLLQVVERCERRLGEGAKLSEELKKSSLIPPLVPRMVAIGESGGSMVNMLGKIADFYEAEVEKISERFLTLLGPLILIGMGLIVGLLMMAILLPLTDMNSLIQR